MKFYEVLLLILCFRLVEELFGAFLFWLRCRKEDEYIKNSRRFISDLYAENKQLRQAKEELAEMKGNWQALNKRRPS